MQADKALAALQKYFGYPVFRPLQQEIIERVYAGGDSLVLMPTGGGKSMCYQLPAITMPGTAVVVSPLISLMKDQVDALVANGITAAFLNSSMDSAALREVEADYEAGRLKLLYVSPEKLLSAGFFPFLRRTKVSLFAIDEAHCISAWGHDFRPEYTQLKQIKASFPEVPILALTATADRLTRIDMAEQLAIPEAKQFISSFDRPNLSLEVRLGQQRRQQIEQFIRQRPEQAGIIYCLSRKQTEELAGKLREMGYDAASYHAGLAPAQRAKVQSDFVNDRTLIVCATIAFGMGIDKSNVRWVIHYVMPKNLENYYQEIGRAGRDGAAADTLLFYSYNDYLTLQEMLGQSPNSEVQLAKLERMKEYADALACRRRILLNYFSEDSGKDCGNCDVCKNPPERFDGTVVAQKALSGVARLKQNVGMNMLIDVLRGSQNQAIRQQGYDQIKTYGAGRDLSTYDWNYYLGQLINLGYLYVAHEDFNKLRLSPAAKRVLFEGEKVELVRFQILKSRREAADQATKSKYSSANPQARGGLFEQLRALRKILAQQSGLPPYAIFSDQTLGEMAAMKPITSLEMARISGVGEVKLHKYGDDFIDAICAYEGLERKEKPIKHSPAPEIKERRTPQSAAESLRLFRSGLDVEAIAATRQMSNGSILGHLSSLYLDGEDFDISRLVDADVIEKVSRIYAKEKPSQLLRLRDLMTHFEENEVSYNELRFANMHAMRNFTKTTAS